MNDHVMVFAPMPLLTVAIEQSAAFAEIHLHPGGQGVWQARMIIRLGTPVVLCASVGGEIGHVLEPLLASEGFWPPKARNSGWSGAVPPAAGTSTTDAPAGASRSPTCRGSR
jgi:1-phosphofructokinase